DHALFRDGMSRLFSYEDDFEVVGEASSGEEALELARALIPDLVLMDIDMPGIGGLEAIRSLARELPIVTVVALTVHEDDETVFEAIKSGAQGYLVKSIRATEMLGLLRGLAHGEAPMTRGVATRILKEFARTTIAGPGAGPVNPPSGHGNLDWNLRQTRIASAIDALDALSSREEEVLELVAQRLTNKEIASKLVISEYTVKNHLRNILAKLHLSSRTQAARLLATGRGQLHHGVPAQFGDGSGHPGASAQ
ncbi:MAG: DNA-binding response regulator, partial [Chloroflexi bacterium]|nr:DNA-binding response regulator [Chloroflexota bacterium]